MTAIRSVRAAEGRFVVLANQAGQDERLTYQARGLVYFVLSLPPDWHLTAAWLETQAPNGRESIRSALRELEKHGYYRRARRKNQAGHWEWDQILSDATAETAALPYDGNPSDGATSENTTFAQVGPSDGNPSDGFPSDKDLRRAPKTKDGAPSAPLRGARSGAMPRQVPANAPRRNARGAA